MISKDKAIAVDFTIIDDVEDMFIALVTALRSLLSEDMFKNLRRAYIIDKKFRKLSKRFIGKIRDTQNLDELFDVIVESDHCNWMNIRLLERIAAASIHCNAPAIHFIAHQLINQYKNAIFSKRLVDVYRQIPEIKVTDNYCSQVKQKWDKEFAEVTLKDIIGQWDRLEHIFDVEPILLLQSVIKSSIQFHWLIPSELVCHAQYSAFKNWHQLDDTLYLDICGYVIKDSQYDFGIVTSNTGMIYVHTCVHGVLILTYVHTCMCMLCMCMHVHVCMYMCVYVSGYVCMWELSMHVQNAVTPVSKSSW